MQRRKKYLFNAAYVNMVKQKRIMWWKGGSFFVGRTEFIEYKIVA